MQINHYHKKMHGQWYYMVQEEQGGSVSLRFLFSKLIQNEPEASSIHMRIINPKGDYDQELN